MNAATNADTVVLAGCGDLGIRVANRVAAAGYRPWALRRDVTRLPSGIPGQSVDLRAEAPELPDGVSTVVIALAPDARDPEQYRAVFVDGVRHVLDGIERSVDAGARWPRVVFVSSISVYGTSDGGWVDELTPAEPSTATGAAIRDAEELLHSRAPDGVVLRLAGLYGPGRGRLLDRVRNGALTLPTPAPYTNRIHIDDAAAALTLLATTVPSPAPIYLGVDEEPVAQDELVDFLAERLGVPPAPRTSEPPARGLGKRCDGSRLRASGLRLTYPSYREGYEALLAAD